MALSDDLSGSQLSRLVLRLGLGINMLMHGLVRIPKLPAFVAKSNAGFADTLLPKFLTTGFLYVLPFAELTCGLLILLGGQFSKWGYALGGLLIAALLFGTTLKEDWATAGIQTIYVIAFAYALRTIESSRRR
ncbi:thiosulfate dehydrogenase [quinone] large subunit [Spirosoma oryzae]|uniref:Thiosulfate dehydrogenase [quinone] large subunit n=1 Tax=Spirosoma oryzae TaxID=1469603 RepID=A0A2T0RSQ3_9BACT|nr:DoxX family protein [Spirosoma oryzae]PRY24123.1 thiosulfate dehydrogenase [quinone] large subunit [Spirosoma oryzae]